MVSEFGFGFFRILKFSGQRHVGLEWLIFKQMILKPHGNVHRVTCPQKIHPPSFRLIESGGPVLLTPRTRCLLFVSF